MYPILFIGPPLTNEARWYRTFWVLLWWICCTHVVGSRHIVKEQWLPIAVTASLLSARGCLAGYKIKRRPRVESCVIGEAALHVAIWFLSHMLKPSLRWWDGSRSAGLSHGHARSIVGGWCNGYWTREPMERTQTLEGMSSEKLTSGNKNHGIYNVCRPGPSKNTIIFFRVHTNWGNYSNLISQKESSRNWHKLPKTSNFPENSFPNFVSPDPRSIKMTQLQRTWQLSRGTGDLLRWQVAQCLLQSFFLKLIVLYIYTYTHMYTYIYIYIFITCYMITMVY